MSAIGPKQTCRKTSVDSFTMCIGHTERDHVVVDCIRERKSPLSPDPDGFAPWFKTDTYRAWRAFLCALFGLPMSPEQFDIFQKCTGRAALPTTPFREGWLVCGRRAGKSFVLAVIAVWLAAFQDYTKYLAPGERATVLILAADRKQSRVIFRYISALLKQVPALALLIEAERAESFELKTRVTIEVGTCSYRTVRGYTFAAVLADELAFWRSEDSASPDYEVINAVRPGMLTIPTAMLLCASSPYARRGALYDAHKGCSSCKMPFLAHVSAGL